jgi:hypothetical protein
VLILTHHSYVLFVSRVRMQCSFLARSHNPASSFPSIPIISRFSLPSSSLFAFCKRHGCHMSVHFPFSRLFTPSFVRCGNQGDPTNSKWPAKLTRLGVDRVGCKKQNRMILVQKPSHGVLLAERAGRESLVQSFQSGIRFLWLFAHESDR